MFVWEIVSLKADLRYQLETHVITYEVLRTNLGKRIMNAIKIQHQYAIQ